MAKRADQLSLLFDAGDVRRLPEGFGSTLASHLVGRQLSLGERVILPGWPPATVEEVDPPDSQVGPGTEVTLHVPPRPSEGALSLVVLVDASLTMRKGDPSPFEKGATAIDGILLNGRSFVQAAGIVVQGGSTRQVEPLKPPEEVSGASILKVEPRGTFDLQEGIRRSLELLEDAPPGPRAVVLVTDGDDAPEAPLETARPLLHAGVTLVATAPSADTRLGEVCEFTGGRAAPDAEGVFEVIAELAGSEADWVAPEPPTVEDDYEFEVVIETMDGSR